jgi:ribose transport system permease protein
MNIPVLKKISGDNSSAMVRSLIILMALIFIAVILSKGVFILPTNLMNMVRQNTMLLFIVMAQLFVLLTGGIDLSVGAVVAITSVVVVLFQGYSIPLALFLCLLVGLISGTVNGLIISFLRLPAFVISLGMQQIVYSVAKIMTNGAKIEHSLNGVVLSSKLNEFYKAEIAGLIIPLWVCIIITVLLTIFMKTKPGYSLYAVGGNIRTAFISGLPVRFINTIAYSISGVLCAFAGFLFVCRVTTGDPDTGTLHALDSIAACTIGGVSLSGGKGSVAGGLIGLLVLCVLNNVMSLVHVSPNVQPLVKGMVILLAVFMNSMEKRRPGRA